MPPTSIATMTSPVTSPGRSFAAVIAAEKEAKANPGAPRATRSAAPTKGPAGSRGASGGSTGAETIDLSSPTPKEVAALELQSKQAKIAKMRKDQEDKKREIEREKAAALKARQARNKAEKIERASKAATAQGQGSATAAGTKAPKEDRDERYAQWKRDQADRREASRLSREARKRSEERKAKATAEAERREAEEVRLLEEAIQKAAREEEELERQAQELERVRRDRAAAVARSAELRAKWESRTAAAQQQQQDNLRAQAARKTGDAAEAGDNARPAAVRQGAKMRVGVNGEAAVVGAAGSGLSPASPVKVGRSSNKRAQVAPPQETPPRAAAGRVLFAPTEEDGDDLAEYFDKGVADAKARAEAREKAAAAGAEGHAMDVDAAPDGDDPGANVAGAGEAVLQGQGLPKDGGLIGADGQGDGAPSSPPAATQLRPAAAPFQYGAPRPPAHTFGDTTAGLDPLSRHQGTPGQANRQPVTPSTAGASGALKPSRYDGVQHNHIPAIDVELIGASIRTNIFGDQTVEGDGEGYVQLAITKRDGVGPNALLHNALADVAEVINRCVPGTGLHAHNSALGLKPLMGRDDVSTMSYPNFQFWHSEAKWALASTRKEKKENRGPDRAYGTLLIKGPCNVKELVEALRYDMTDCGYELSWKQVQAKVSTASLQFYGIPAALCSSGLRETLQHVFSEAEQQLIKEGTQSFEFQDVPVPNFSVYFKKSRPGQLPPEAHGAINLDAIPGHKENGCRLLILECAPEDMGRMGPVWQYVQNGGLLKKYILKASIVATPPGRATTASIIATQRNKAAHLKYGNKMYYVALSDIVCLDKKVEARRRDEARPAHKFITLRSLLMDMKSRSTGKPLFHSIIKRLWGPGTGTHDLMMLTKDDEAKALAQNMQDEGFAPWIWHYARMEYTDNCVRSLMDGLDIQAAELAANSTWDSATLTCKYEFAFANNFAADMEEWLSDIEEEEVVQGGVVLSGEARAELAQTLHDRDDFEFGSNAGASRRTDFDQSVGNSTNASFNTARHARQGKDRALKNIELAKQNSALQEAQQQMEEQIRSLQAALAAERHGPPPDSGSASPGNSPPSQEQRVGHNGEAQG